MAAIFKIIKPEQIKDNPFYAIGSEGMLIAAGTLKDYNMMTASWGGFGVLWHKNICFCVIRPHRYTREFMEKAEYFTLNFFKKRYKKVLDFCGTKSGRDVNKMTEAGLTAENGGKGIVYFNEARLVIVCKKIYFQEIEPANFLDPGIEENYPKKDYHRMYVGEIVRCLQKAKR
jgi:flavin reductase (DIM6/NTAB) family NADH-FMN oxidoreductase RutF